jgi:hypothetical protein
VINSLTEKKMGRKNPGRKSKPRNGSAGSAVDSLEAELSDLFKTLPPIKRADLTKVRYVYETNYPFKS